MAEHSDKRQSFDFGNQSPWALDSDKVLDYVGVDPEEGLSPDEAERRREIVGPNSLRERSSKGAAQIFVDQFKSIIIGLLVAAAGVAFIFGEVVEMVAIMVVVVINTAIGFFTELRAVRSMEALRKIAEVTVFVRREGAICEIPSRELVPGDIVVLEAGNMVGADMRLVESAELEADESVLTGESVPVSKEPEPVAADTVLADRRNMLFRGTAVTRGHAAAVVVGTGMETEVGRISELVEEASERETPLEHRLDELGRKLVWVCLVLAALVAGIGAAQGKELFVVIETAIALAVATIPEGLPIVATIALARGMWRMADQNALIRNLAVVETLGSADTILTDKTGTLTENHMTVRSYCGDSGEIRADSNGSSAFEFRRGNQPVSFEDDPVLKHSLEVGLLCNDETRRLLDEESEQGVGEPMEVGLAEAAIGAGLDAEGLLDEQPRVAEEPFDAGTKMMATYHDVGERIRVAVKGAPEAVLSAATRLRTDQNSEPMDEQSRQEWLEANERMAESGLRLLALAEKYVDDIEAPPYEDLEFLTLVGMVDPARSDVREALDAARSAGIRVVMVTGDQPGTAVYIARELEMDEPERLEAVHGKSLSDFDDLSDERERELLDTAVFARVSPEQKLDLIELHQQQGAVVAMTGDGVNDAPALVQADIGIAMGERGTQVAQEASDMVLGDDRFATIVTAIEQGRIIFENIRNFAVYLLSCNVSELLIVSLAALAFPSARLPLTALQILYLNLVTDVFPALALGLGEGDKKMMERPPRERSEPILGSQQWSMIAGFGSALTVVVLATFYLVYFEWEFAPDRAVTISFLTLAFAQLWHVFNMRARGSNRINNDVTRNPFVWGALALCVGLLLAVVYIPPLALAVDVVPPGIDGWTIAVTASLIPVVIGLFRR